MTIRSIQFIGIEDDHLKVVRRETREHPEADACVAELDEVLKRHGFNIVMDYDNVTFVREKPGVGGVGDLGEAFVIHEHLYSKEDINKIETKEYQDRLDTMTALRAQVFADLKLDSTERNEKIFVYCCERVAFENSNVGIGRLRRLTREHVALPGFYEIPSELCGTCDMTSREHSENKPEHPFVPSGRYYEDPGS